MKALNKEWAMCSMLYSTWPKFRAQQLFSNSIFNNGYIIDNSEI